MGLIFIILVSRAAKEAKKAKQTTKKPSAAGAKVR
jgi:hypothetical protein